MPRWLYLGERERLPTVQEVGWFPELVWTCAEYLALSHPSKNKITKIQLFTIKVLTQLPRGQTQTQYKDTKENNQTPKQKKIIRAKHT